MATYKKRSDGRYQTRVYLGVDENNKKVFKYIYAKSIAELKQKETELRGQKEKGIDITSANDSLCGEQLPVPLTVEILLF